MCWLIVLFGLLLYVPLAGTYGLCEVCGKPIGAARLEAMPAARLCIADAAKH